MAESGKKGVYANRPLDPDSKRAARKAQAAAVHTLADAYRLLVEIIVDHNNRPHSALRRRKVLTLHGVEPTPKNAYLWGLKHITGLHSAPYSEEDYHRLLLSSDKASISNGVLRYRTRAYHPANEAAIDFISRSSKKLTSLGVRLDKTLPTEIFLPSRHGDWPKFVMGTGDARDIEGISLDEEDAFATCNARLWARSSHESRRKRVADKSAKTRKAKVGTPPAAIVSNAEQQAARYRETAQFKEQLHGRPIDEVGEAEDQSAASTKTWMQVEQDERARLVEIAAQKRKRKNK